jgi:hypothetical protein
MIYINESAIVGQKFTVLSASHEWTCIGYAKNETLLIIGTYYDSNTDESMIKSFKFSDVKFKGVLLTSIK